MRDTNGLKPTTPLNSLFRLSEFQRKALKKLGLENVNDLLYHFPTRYEKTAPVKKIAELQPGERAVIFGYISELKTTKAFFKKIPMAKGVVNDETGKIKVVWFNQPYLAKIIPTKALVRLEGKISERKNIRYLSNPKIEKINNLPLAGGHTSLFSPADQIHHYLYPIYPESRGLSSNWFYHSVQKILRQIIWTEYPDPIPGTILKKYNLPSLRTALFWIHAPKKENDALAARKRFSFEEIFLIQLERQKARREYKKGIAYKIAVNKEKIKDFENRFPWQPTAAQRKALETILDDFKKPKPMTRLLEGDVGSGKTFVAAAAAYAVTIASLPGENVGNLQTAYLCPTEVLASQQFENFISFFANLPIKIGLITSTGCRKFPSKVNPDQSTNISRSQLLQWVKSGEIAILIGTHSLIQKTVAFKHLAFVIIDEQHRFGTQQRASLLRKTSTTPHLLSMSATPIPRTLSLTIFGDLDLTILDEMPPGRKPIITEIVLKSERSNTYEKIRKELQAGRQAYVICPRIDEPDPTRELSLEAKSVKEEAKRLKEKIFPEFTIGLLHGKMKPAEKDKAMTDFKNGKTNILVATSVVEVGVNVPNATVIVIEGAERFGLAQIHQLRGRVLRSTHQAYCYIFTETAGRSVRNRLKALKEAKNGFELAEYDLKLRGPGTLQGLRQWGISDVGMEALQNLKMVEAARAEAEIILDADADLKKYPLLKERVSGAEKNIHFE
jgi:ATP-dependent DNA helicase RecG